MEQDLTSFETLKGLVARLRAPDGCPWDRAQDHISLKRYLIEEAYEVLQALEEGKADKLCEELGDLLLQILLHAQIASEAGEFEIGDVIRSIATKIVRRHPHVFSVTESKDAQEVAHDWEKLKREEYGEDTSLLSSVPPQMPALAYSQAIQQRAARVGFDWKEFEGILEKIGEEVGEIREAQSLPRRVQEFGDLLFVLANAARWLEVDPEEALRLANERFYQRFLWMEEACRQRGLSLEELSFDEQNVLWEEAKKALL